MKDEILKLRSEGLTYDQIIGVLGCSKSTVSYHCNKNGLGKGPTTISDDTIKKINEYYETHTVEETSNKFSVGTATVVKYTKNKRVKLTKEERRLKNIIAVQKRRRKLKKMAVEYKGGCCQECGYHKYISVLEFHHRDPNEKDFGISTKTNSWEIIKNELDKCDMLCANCHRELHEELDK